MDVAYFGYRPWALKISQYLLNKWPYWKIIKVIDKENVDLYEAIKDIKYGTVLFFCGWSSQIPKDIYDKYLCLVLHPSPLPKYRGGSPLQHQIMNGEKMSAVTIFKVNDKLDSGDIYSQVPFSLDGSLNQIFQRIIDIAVPQIVEVLGDIALHKAKPIKQNEAEATTYKRRKPEESELTSYDLMSMTSKQIYNFIRALGDPYPNAFIRCRDNKKVYLKEAKIDE